MQRRGTIVAMKAELPILYLDEHLVAVDKPSGLFVHRSALTRGEHTFVVQRLRQQLGIKVYPIHRLDRATSGVLLFALDPKTTAAVSAQFAGGLVTKSYCAIVRGHPAESGIVDHPVAPAKSNRKREAVTRYQRLEIAEIDAAVGRYQTARYALLGLQPKTGRRHQLRRHCAHLAHPIIGDTTYGDRFHNRYFRQTFDCHRLLLTAFRLEFMHPYSETPVSIEAPCPAIFAEICNHLGWTAPTARTASAFEVGQESLSRRDDR